MLVEKVMTKDVITCSPSDPLTSIVKLMGEKDISGMPVMENDKLVGIVTEGDIMKVLAVPRPANTLWLPSPLEVILEIPVRDVLQLRRIQDSFKDVGAKPVKDIMTKKVITISPDDDIENAAGLMVGHKINRLPVVKGGKLVGIITRDDIIQGLGGTK